MKFNLKSALRTILPVLITAILGTIFQKFASFDYETINKPYLAPPKIVFPIVWTILYILIAISAYIFDSKSDDREEKIRGLIIFYIGLLFNALWPLFYFTLNLKLFAAIWLGMLYVISASNFVAFRKKDKISGYLLIPYLIWLLFALYLNIGTAILN